MIWRNHDRVALTSDSLSVEARLRMSLSTDKRSLSVPRGGSVSLLLRWIVAAAAMLALCSCRAAPISNAPDSKAPITPVAHTGAPGIAFAGLPAEAYTGHPQDEVTEAGVVPPHMLPPRGDVNPVSPEARPYVPPMPYHAYGPWKPPGIGCPWPEDEYIFDGGDNDGGVKVRDDWVLQGLDEEDTVLHYDTLDGRTVVKPTNRVCLYAPRFAAVRQVTLPYGDNQLVKAGGVDMPIGPLRQDDVQPVTTAVQPVQPVAKIGERGPVTFLEKQPPVGLVAQTVLRAMQDRFKPYEDFALVREGVIDEAEKPLLAIMVNAAIQWTADQGVQVIIDGKKAGVLEGERRAQATYQILPGKPCLRVCKVASTPSALPGEVVEFTIRFDNVGEQPVGNVTIADNLTTRLELLPDSGQCSRTAEFFTEPNEQGSLVLRWEITDPINPGEGGIARFKCKVR